MHTSEPATKQDDKKPPLVSPQSLKCIIEYNPARAFCLIHILIHLKFQIIDLGSHHVTKTGTDAGPQISISGELLK